MLLAAEQDVIAIDHQHDGHGIGAGKMLGGAGRAIAPPARLDRTQWAAPQRAQKPWARVPMQDALGLRQHRDSGRPSEALLRKRAKVADLQSGMARQDETALVDERRIARFLDLRGLVGQPERENRAFRVAPEQDLGLDGAEFTRAGEGVKGAQLFAIEPQDRHGLHESDRPGSSRTRGATI